MLFSLLRHQIQQGFRSAAAQRNIVINIFLAFFGLYMLASLMSIGFFADIIVQKVNPGENPYPYISSIFFYYFLLMFVVRFYFQKMPALTVQPYLHLPISRNRLINFMLIRSNFGLFNFLDLAVWIPMAVRMVVNNYSFGEAAIWFTGMLTFSLFNSYLALYVTRMFSSNFKLALAFLLAFAGIVALDYYSIVSLMDASRWFFMQFLEQPIYIGIPVILLVGAYFLNFNDLRGQLYLDKLVARKKVRAKSLSQLNWLSQFGEVGELMGLEARLILRHKRTRSVLMLSAFFLLYGLFFYTQEQFLSQPVWLMFVGTMITGIFMLNYGQFIYSWESSYYDNLLTQRFSPESYVRAKYLLFAVTGVTAFLLSLPYFYFGWKVVFINLCLCLYNLGVNVFVIFIFGTFGASRLDLSRSSSMNLQGVRGAQFLLSLPVLMGPMLIVGPFLLFATDIWGFVALGSVGIIGILTSNFWIKQITKRLSDKKYTMAEAFRES